MKGALIHGGLLVIMLVYGYKEWTKDRWTGKTGDVVLWNSDEADLTKIELVSDGKTVRLEHRSAPDGAYWWGSETKTTKKPKPVTSSTPDGKPAEPEMEDVATTREFPVGDAAKTTIDKFVHGRALSELGKLSDDDKDKFKLKDSKTTLSIVMKGKTHTLTLGGPTFGTSTASAERYALDTETGVGYVLSRDMLSGIDAGETGLKLVDPRGFDPAKIAAVTLATPDGKSRTAARITTDVEGKPVKTFGDKATGKPDQTLANFVDSLAGLKPSQYEPTLQASDLTLVLTASYADESGSKLGTLRLFKHNVPGELPEDGSGDPANPPMVTEYYVLTEKTRVPGLVARTNGERAELDVVGVMTPGAEAPAPQPADPTAPVPGSATEMPKPVPAGPKPTPAPTGATGAAPIAPTGATGAIKPAVVPPPTPVPTPAPAPSGAH